MIVKKKFTRKPAVFIGGLERYLFACLYCHKKRVLDIGCKDGYGSHLISTFADYVGLVDINLTHLKWAQELYNFFCPIEIFNLDLQKDFPKGKYDIIVAFDIIEHVKDPDFLVKNIATALAKDGLLVFSVPHMVVNPDHKTLFDDVKIKNLISKYLKIEEFYYQNKVGVSGKTAVYPPLCYVGVAKKL